MDQAYSGNMLAVEMERRASSAERKANVELVRMNNFYRQQYRDRLQALNEQGKGLRRLSHRVKRLRSQLAEQDRPAGYEGAGQSEE